MSNYPISLDNFANPTASNTLANSNPSHSQQHSNLNDAVEALESKVGIDGSADTDSHDYKLSNVIGSDKAAGLSNLTDFITEDSVKALTNTTFNANGTGNVLSNVEVADFAASAIVTESETIESNDNDTTLPTSAAVKDYVDRMSDVLPFRAVRATSRQVIAPNTTIVVQFNSVVYDPDSCWDGTNFRYIVQRDGVYSTKASIYFGNNTSIVSLNIRKNNSTIASDRIIGQSSGANSGEVELNTQTDIDAVVGDYLDVRVLHTNSADQEVFAIAGTNFTVHYVGPLT